MENMDKTVSVGLMPGRIETFAVEAGATIQDVLNLAGHESQGYTVKVDGQTVSNLGADLGNARTVLLAKNLKGSK